MSKVLDLISRIGEAEDRLTEMEFVSPIFNNRQVATLVHGMVYTLKVPRVDPGWYKLRAVDGKRAKIVGEAQLWDRDEYLKRFGRVRLTLVMRHGQSYLAVPDKSNPYSLPPAEPIPVLLFDDRVMDFDRIWAVYDGANLWYKDLDYTNDQSKAGYLREALDGYTEPAKIGCSGLTFEEKLAYSLRYSLDKQIAEGRKKARIRKDVEHAGGELIRFVERSDHISVTYVVDGEQFTSHIMKDDTRRVIAAGICLQGNDHKFDLASLVTVIREAQNRDLLHKYHDIT